MAGRNLVICCDGTGNRGGVTPDTNVYRIFRGLDRKDPGGNEQLRYYDDGVGTERSKYLRALGGAMGWGFTKNVEDAYCFLCRNWQEGDRIYLFGFSRGAYTVRALAALVISAGILPAKDLSEKDLADASAKLRRTYDQFQAARRAQEERLSRMRDGSAQSNGHNEKNLIFEDFWKSTPLPGKRVHFIGVWDTVSALGLPFDIGLKRFFESFINRYRFIDNYLSDRVEKGRHALSLDDQRQTFHPEVWNEWKLLSIDEVPKSKEIVDSIREPEKKPKAVYVPCTNVDQAWFAGVHSNVGGGYPKSGLDYVTLEWMIRDLKDELGFTKGFLEDVDQSSDAHGRLYDSRAGVGAYYRYRPRQLGELHGFDRLRPRRADEPNGRVDLDRPTLKPSVHIHESVLRRIEARTDGYDPGNLPADVPVEIVDSHQPPQEAVLGKFKARWDKGQADRTKCQEEARVWFLRREKLHLAFVLMNLLLVLSLIHIGLRPRDLQPPPGPFEWAPISWKMLTPWLLHYVAPLSLVAALLLVSWHNRHRSALLPFLTAGLVLVAITMNIDLLPPRTWNGGAFKWILEFLLPDMVAQALFDVIAQHPFPALISTLAAIVLFILRWYFGKQSEGSYELLNDSFRKATVP